MQSAQSEVERSRRELERFAPGDELKTRQRLNAQLQGLLQSTRKTLELLRAKLTREERLLAERTIREVGATSEGSLEEMQGALSNLESVSEMLGQAVFRSAKPPEVDPDEP